MRFDAYSLRAPVGLWDVLRPYRRYLYLIGAMGLAAIAGKALN